MWQKGQSGNPGGQEKVKLFKRALREVLTLEEAKQIARKVVQMAKEGDLMAVNIVADRLDGKPQQSVEITDERSNDLAGRFEEILAGAAEAAGTVHTGDGKTGTRRVN